MTKVETSQPLKEPVVPAGAPTRMAVLRLALQAYRVELLLFVACYVLFASFSAQRFLRQSAAPHFVYQAQAWLDGRLELDPAVLPNLEDWACARDVGGHKVRCEGAALAGDRWYVSFPWFPAVVMLPFVALHGYQFNDTSFDVFFGALGVALFYSLLRFLKFLGESERSRADNVVLALVLGVGSVFFYCAIRGEVWFTAEVMGVTFTCLYLRMAVRARRPLLAGLFFSMATLTRTPLAFGGVFFLLELACPEREDRLGQLRRLLANPRPLLRPLGMFVLGALPLAIAAAAYNQVRFGHLGEFGHDFLFHNRVNADIDLHGLFSPVYLGRNLQAAFFELPAFLKEPLRLVYNPTGLTLFLTLPFLPLLVIPSAKEGTRQRALLLVLGALMVLGLADLGGKSGLLGSPLTDFKVFQGALLAVSAAVFGGVLMDPSTPRLHVPLWLTAAVCAAPGLLYQNTGYMQFGFRFSLDYTPYLVVLFALSAWSLRNLWVQGVLGLGMLVNFWGAVAFRGYTELTRGG